MKQILVATDFSASAANAMIYALELASVLNRKVCVMHAIHPTEGINNSIYDAIFIEDYYNNKRHALQEWTDNILDNDRFASINVTTLCEVGFLKSVITEYVRDHAVELLVMGVTGGTGITGIVGSNTSVVLTKVKIPTLLIPLESKFSKAPMITLATDFETRLSAEDVYALNEMIKGTGVEKMQVLYIVEKGDKNHIAAGEEKLTELILHASLDFKYTENDSASRGITNFITDNHTDILCLVKHHHNIVYRLFSRSTVNMVITKSVKAILVLHE